MRYLIKDIVIVILLSIFTHGSCQNDTITWCVLSDAEEQKCMNFAGNITGKSKFSRLLCTRAYNSIDCMEKIKNGSADAATMEPHDIYSAGWCYGLELAAGESYNSVDGINYYVVALARKSSSDLSLLEMHEKSSCHPGIQTTVGWTVPVGFLVNTSQISIDEHCNFPKVVGDFFGFSCVPGVKDPEFDPKGNNPKNLCEACIGDDNDKNICANNPAERHFGEAGALRCVAENLGDVAFVKHSNRFIKSRHIYFVLLQGKNQESWAKDLELEDLKLLCPDGTEAGLNDYKKCSLAAVPANAVVVRPEDKCRVYNFLNRAQRMFSNTTEGFSLFAPSPYEGKDLMFSDNTQKLLKIMGNYQSWLGPSYLTVNRAFDCEGLC
ncbi:otolith matrix protein 1 [Erpetoichthys calabaricus]|uniref:otolith matrix protein 1 n=1 Tax=Erpetoichthys calabaricus TaxID=27687 RepID=UPI0022343FDC|nr:otolith matrix protein 1 [Erpetoichthys calabaricus]